MFYTMLISTPLALYNIINDHVNNKILMGPFVPLPCVYPNKGRSWLSYACTAPYTLIH